MPTKKPDEIQSRQQETADFPVRPEVEEARPELPLGRALFRVMRSMMFDDRPAAELDALPLAQLRLLWTVHHSQEATMKDFSERLCVSQSTVTQLADRLVKRGLVDRLADVSDRRVVRLRISEAGKLLLEEADRQRKSTLYAVWKTLTATERQEALRGLEVLGHAAETVREAQGRPLPPLPERFVRPASGESASEKPEETQPVVDLMARRVRGRTLPS